MISYDSEFEVLMFDCSRSIYFWKQVYSHIVNIPYNWIIRGSPTTNQLFPKKSKNFLSKPKGQASKRKVLYSGISRFWKVVSVTAGTSGNTQVRGGKGLGVLGSIDWNL